MSFLHTVAMLVVAAGVIAGALTARATRSIRAGLAVMLELWMAGGLLGLSSEGSWRSIAVAAAVVVFRKLVIFALAYEARIHGR